MQKQALPCKKFQEDFLRKILLREVGPRDGFQLESTIIPTTMKIAVIEQLALAGFTHIQAASFVHPKKAPQMADAHNVFSCLRKTPSVTYSALVLNQKGLELAFESGCRHVEISISASHTHSMKNSGMSGKDAEKALSSMIQWAIQKNMNPWASIQCAFGCVHEGSISPSHVIHLLHNATDSGAKRLVLADTTGMATPTAVMNLVQKIEQSGVPLKMLWMHLHDTRGLGLVNLMTALECGITGFDTALGGMGGCPFVPGAAGNIATEDTVYLLKSLGAAIDIDINLVSKASRQLETFLGHGFAGKLYSMDLRFS